MGLPTGVVEPRRFSSFSLIAMHMSTQPLGAASTNVAAGQADLLMHASLFVADLSKSVSFYTAFFGQEPVKVEADYAKFELTEPGLVFSLLENPDRVFPTFGHMGFRVASTEALQERLEAARQAGLPVREEMGTSCCYALQDKFWVSDPDGFQWEVYQFHGDVQFEDPHAPTAKGQDLKTPPSPANMPATGNVTVAAGGDPSASSQPVSGCC